MLRNLKSKKSIIKYLHVTQCPKEYKYYLTTNHVVTTNNLRDLVDILISLSKSLLTVLLIQYRDSSAIGEIEEVCCSTISFSRCWDRSVGKMSL